MSKSPFVINSLPNVWFKTNTDVELALLLKEVKFKSGAVILPAKVAPPVCVKIILGVVLPLW